MHQCIDFLIGELVDSFEQPLCLFVCDLHRTVFGVGTIRPASRKMEFIPF